MKLRSLNRDKAVIFSSADEFNNSYPVWGNGGWLPPDERMSLDWFALFRLMGLRTEVMVPDTIDPVHALWDDVKWIILGCPIESLPKKFSDHLKEVVLNHAVTVIGPFSLGESPIGGWWGEANNEQKLNGTIIRADFLSQKLLCQNGIEFYDIGNEANANVIAWIDDFPIITTKTLGAGRLIRLAFDPGEAQDREGYVTHVLQNIIVHSADKPMAWQSWQGTLILRMDDPGSAESIYNEAYRRGKLSADQWSKVGDLLAKENARMTIGYVTGWVDDGDESRGDLFIDGVRTERVPGRIYPSPTVKYDLFDGPIKKSFDYASEFGAIQSLQVAGRLDVAMHGFTHIFPDKQAWLAAPDRFTNVFWFREFSAEARKVISENPALPDPFKEGLRYFSSFFKLRPKTIIFPGEEFTRSAVVDALEAGIQLVSSYYLAFRDDDRFCWAQRICAPYLDQPDSKWFESGLPVVGYFHDFDIIENGVDWLSVNLRRWREKGANRIIDLHQFNISLNTRIHIAIDEDQYTLVVEASPQVILTRPITIQLFFPDNQLPDSIKTLVNGVARTERVRKLNSKNGSILLKF